MAQSQHMRALEQANSIRLARAALKREVRAGERSIADVIEDPPECAATMTVAELLRSQRRWAAIRTRKFLAGVQVSEQRRLGDLTIRQRGLICGALPASSRAPAGAVDI